MVMTIFEFIKMLFASKVLLFFLCLALLVVVSVIRAIYNDYFSKD